MKIHPIVLLLITALFALSVPAYTATQVADVMQNNVWRPYVYPNAFASNNQDAQTFVNADTNGDGATTGTEHCAAFQKPCLLTQDTALLTLPVGQMNLAGTASGCEGGEENNLYYPGMELEGWGRQDFCITDAAFGRSFTYLRQSGGAAPGADTNGDGIITGQEFCRSYSMDCAFTMRSHANFPDQDGNAIGGPFGGEVLGCHGGSTSYTVEDDRLVACTNDVSIANAFQNGGTLRLPFPFSSSHSDYATFVAADINGDTAVTGEEYCNYFGKRCAFTQDVQLNVEVSPGRSYHLSEPVKGCHGGETISFYEQNQDRGFVVQCLADTPASQPPATTTPPTVTIQDCPPDCYCDEDGNVLDCTTTSNVPPTTSIDTTTDPFAKPDKNEQHGIITPPPQRIEASKDVEKILEQGQNYPGQEELPGEQSLGLAAAPCNGCITEPDDVCVPFGYRREGRFCDVNGLFNEQLVGDSFCENNFQCKSNVCVDSKCVSPGFFEKLFSWFENWFG